MKTALSIAGSDCSGGAGIQADLKTMTMNGVYAMTAITALTAQNTTGVSGILEVSPEFLCQQLDMIFTDIRPDAVKIGMVSSAPLIRAIAQRLRQYQAQKIVVDPVMVATSGARLIEPEAIETLKGRGPEDLTCVCLELAANMLYMAGRGDMEQCRKLAQGAIEDGSALKCLKSMVESQGGDGRYVENPGLFHKAPLSREVKASETGFITHMDTEGIGVASVMLGAGRDKKEDTIDYSAGILLEKKYGDSVREGETIAVLYASHEELFGPAVEKFLASCTLGKQMPEPEPLIFARISDAGVERRTIEEKIP